MKEHGILMQDEMVRALLRPPGDPRCHCTPCSSCWRLYRTEDINAHRDVCTIRLIVSEVYRG